MSVPPPPPGHPYAYPTPPAPPPTAPPPPARTNGLAVAALVLGILFAPLGIVFGIVALVQINRKGEKGRGLAIAGVAVGSVSVVLSVTLFAFGATVLGERYDGEVAKSAFSLDKGDCFHHSGEWDTKVYDVKAIDCDAPHNAEVVGEFDLYGIFEGEYPGEKKLSGTADTRCTEVADAYSLDSWALPSDLYYAYYIPTHHSWALGDRTVSCFWVKEKGELTESVRADEATLNEHQLAYLQAVNILNTQYADSPKTQYVDEDLPGYKEWAGRVAEAVEKEKHRLRAHTWPSDAQKEVHALAESLDKAQVHWEKASEAANVDTYWTHHQQAEQFLGQDLAVEARRELGLAYRLSGSEPIDT